MTTTAWAHLPNAEHIDRILADLRLRPQAWVEVYADPTQEAARDAAWGGAQDIPWSSDWDAAWDAIRRAAKDAAQGADRFAIWDAATALIAWDDCGYILDLHPNVVRLMAASGNQPAILLEAAVIAMHEEPKP